MRRSHDGAIGDVLILQANDSRGPIRGKPRSSDWSDMTYQVRNWYDFTWLSGDFDVEQQHVHLLVGDGALRPGEDRRHRRPEPVHRAVFRAHLRPLGDHLRG